VFADRGVDGAIAYPGKTQSPRQNPWPVLCRRSPVDRYHPDQKKAEKPKVKTAKQLSFADILGKPQQGTSPYFEGEKINFTSAKTTLDRVHQSMVLFAMGESGYLKRLLVEEGAGVGPKHWLHSCLCYAPATRKPERLIEEPSDVQAQILAAFGYEIAGEVLHPRSS